MSEFYQQDRGARSADEWQRREEDRERRDHGQKRQQAELFDTPADREYAAHYSYQSLVCVWCQHVLAGHDFPLGKCMEPGCRCPGFKQVAD